MASFFPMYWWRLPPNSLVILYLPSLKAPAPPKPFIMAQVGQLIQPLIFTPSIGHFLFSRGFPASRIQIFSSGLRRTSSKAVNIPPGPAPIIAQSYFIYFELYPKANKSAIDYFLFMERAKASITTMTTERMDIVRTKVLKEKYW